jgi:hypothetical protein
MVIYHHLRPIATTEHQLECRGIHINHDFAGQLNGVAQLRALLILHDCGKVVTMSFAFHHRRFVSLFFAYHLLRFAFVVAFV